MRGSGAGGAAASAARGSRPAPPRRARPPAARGRGRSAGRAPSCRRAGSRPARARAARGRGGRRGSRRARSPRRGRRRTARPRPPARAATISRVGSASARACSANRAARSGRAARAAGARPSRGRGRGGRSDRRPRRHPNDRCDVAASAPAHEAGDGGHQLLGALLLDLRGAADHAVAGVVVHEAERDLVERGLDRGDLRQDVDAVAVLLDHLLDAADLALDALEALLELLLGGRVPARGVSGGGHGQECS